MPSGSTTQFFLAAEGPRSQRQYLLALGAFVWTFCLGCTVLSVVVEALTGGMGAIVGSPVIIGAALLPNIALAFGLSRLLQRYQTTHRYVLIGAFLAGAVVAIPPALVLNTVLFLPIDLSKSSALQLLGFGTIPGIVEEGIKGLIVLFIFQRYRDEFHDQVDGITIGALVGLGFAMTEDINYFFRGLSGGGVIGLAFTLFLRLGLGWMNHSVFTAITGLGFGLSRRHRRGSAARWLLPLGGYVAAAALHNSFDFLATLLGQLLSGSPLALLLSFGPLYGITWSVFAILGFLVIRGWHQEAELLRAELPADVDAGVVTAKEYFALPNPKARKALLRETAASAGPAARRAQAKVFELAMELAWQRRHDALGDRPGVPELHSAVMLQRRIGELRPLLAGVPAQPAAYVQGGLPPAPPPAPHAGNGPSSPADQAAPPTVFSSAPPNWPDAAPAAPPGIEPDARDYRLVQANDPGGGAVPLQDGLTIGRNPRLAHLVLTDPEVSGLHARVARDGGPPILIDANSTNGTFVNDQRITNRPLRPGDRVRIGGVQLLVETHE